MLPVAILAGGLATRLRPLTELVPKALIEINGEAFLSHQLKLLKGKGIREVVLCVGHLGEQVREFAGDGSRFGLHVEYSFDGPKLLGTAGALRQALPYLGPAFFVLYGDSYLTCDYLAVERRFSESNKLGLMTVFENAGRGDTSNVEFSGGQILDYNKLDPTARMRHIDYGLGVFAARAFDELDSSKPHDLAALYGNLLLRGELAAYEVDEMFHEIGSVGGIEELGEFLRPRVYKAPRRAVFLDRDGVLNEAVLRDGLPYPPDSVDEMRVAADAAASLARLKEAGFELIVVTNQPDVGRGKQTREAVEAIHAALAAQLPIDEFRACYHSDADGCGCRKPKPGMLEEAARRRGIDLGDSFMIGDRWRDVDAGATAGCRTVLIDFHYSEREPDHAPDFRAANLAEAANWILQLA